MKKVIYVDIDDNICEHPREISMDGNRKYDAAIPLMEKIEKINSLYDQGYEIVYWTARGSRSGIDWKEMTEKQLKGWGAKFHKLRTDKPYYDIFIEDRSMLIGELKIYISHRGNINGRNMDSENTPTYLDNAIKQGYDVELDVRTIGGKLFLGHDEPDIEIKPIWLLERSNRLWIHTKDMESFINLMQYKELRLFSHAEDPFVPIYNTDLVWAHNLSLANSKSVIPLLDKKHNVDRFANMDVYAICSDYVRHYKNAFENKYDGRREI